MIFFVSKHQYKNTKKKIEQSSLGLLSEKGENHGKDEFCSVLVGEWSILGPDSKLLDTLLGRIFINLYPKSNHKIKMNINNKGLKPQFITQF